MIKRIISLALCMTMLICCLSACGSSGENKQLVFPIDSEPEYLDPQIVSDIGAKNIIANCFEGLVSLDESGQVIPAAAKDWNVSSDGLVYTFNLRDDLQWKVTRTAGNNTIGENYATEFNTALTAADFVFGIRRALRPETRSPYAGNLMSIKNAVKVNSGKLSDKQLGVSVADERTVVFTLERPDPDFLLALTTPACMPCSEKFFNLTKGRYGLSTAYLIYNGPFYISNWAESTAITARKSDKYHAVLSEDGKTWVSQDTAKPSSIYYSFNNEQSSRGRKVKDGTYDVAPLTSEQANEIAKNKKYVVKQFNNSMLSLVFNCADEVTKNINIRRSIAQSFKMDTALSALNQKAAVGIVPSAMLFADKSYRQTAKAFSANTVSEKQAAKLLRTGLDELDKRDVQLTVLCEQENENTVRSLMQQWQSIFGVIFGISVEVVDSQTLQQRLKNGEYQIAMAEVKYDESSAYNCVARYTSNSRDNFVSLRKKQYDNIVKKYVFAKDEGAKRKVIEEAESYLISCSVIVPICEKSSYYGITKKVTDIHFSATGDVVYFKDGKR